MLRRRVLSIGLPVVCVLPLAWITLGGILHKVGEPAPPLDDTFIHFQYARAFAAGHPFRYQPGEPVSTGATSLLWPMVLAPFYALGLRDMSLVWPAWVLSFAAFAGLIYEAYRVAAPLTGRATALGAAALVWCFGPFTWFAASGMEVVPFAWALLRSVRVASEYAEGQEKRSWMLVLMAWLTSGLRPEGAVMGLLLAITLGMKRHRVLAGATALGAVWPSLFLWMISGSGTPTTAKVKLLWGNPYYPWPVWLAQVETHARMLVQTLLNGEVWSAEFIPHGAMPVFVAGLVAVATMGHRRQRRWRAFLVLALSLSIFIPTTYVTFLSNRLRYLWPFSTAWLVGMACLSRVLSDLGLRFAKPARAVGLIGLGVAAGLCLAKLEWVIQDVVESSSGIARQHVTMARWVREHTPAAARIGVNDTGALAYLTGRKTFDIVGLTTSTEGRYWVAGPASRFEHYERLGKGALPSHFVVYPEWMACNAILGPVLFDATVTDATILGGPSMRAFETDVSLLGTGETPWSTSHPIVDTLDVADLESEAAHGYELLDARDGEQRVRTGEPSEGQVVADGGRMRRRDAFLMDATAGGQCIVRLEVAEPGEIEVRVNGEPVTTLHPPTTHWAEEHFSLSQGGRLRIELSSSSAMTTYHYWTTR